MSSLQSLREFISERLAAAAEEIFRLCEGTIVHYEQELCRQRRLPDIRKPHLQLNAIDPPMHYVTEKLDLCNRHRNSRAEPEEPEPPQSKEQNEQKRPNIEVELKEPEPSQIENEQGEPEPQQIKEEQEELQHPQIKEEQEGLFISQEEEQLDLKETCTLMKSAIYEENEHSEEDLNSQQSFNITDRRDAKGSKEKESSSADPQSGAQMKTRQISHVQNVDSFCVSESQCDSDFRTKTKMGAVVRCEQSTEENRLSSINSDKWVKIANNGSLHTRYTSDKRPYVCEKCGKKFRCFSPLKSHMRTHTGEKIFSCEVCNACFSHKCTLIIHKRTHTGEKPFSCKECDKRFSDASNLKRHTKIHIRYKPFSL